MKIDKKYQICYQKILNSKHYLIMKNDKISNLLSK